MNQKTPSDAAAEALARRFWTLRICESTMQAGWDDLPPHVREAKMASAREFIEREILGPASR